MSGICDSEPAPSWNSGTILLSSSDDEETPRVWEAEPTDSETPPEEYHHQLAVPGLVDLAKPAFEVNQTRYVYYRTTFDIREYVWGIDPYTRPGGKDIPWVTLRIGAARYGTTVWLNGTEVGSSTYTFAPQEYDLTDALNRSRENELVIRVGRHREMDLQTSAAGYDLEQEAQIPGIWGDVTLQLTGKVRIRNVRLTPYLESKQIKVDVWLESRYEKPKEIWVTATGSRGVQTTIQPEDQESMVSMMADVRELEEWSPQNPAIIKGRLSVTPVGLKYRMVQQDTSCEEPDYPSLDEMALTYALRTFEVRDGDFYLNGNRVLLRGTNIAFHRWLADPERKALAWDEDFIRAVLTKAKEGNMPFIRFHVGPAYEKWYDIADELGLLIQDEWGFWGFSGGVPTDSDVILEEMHAWVESRWNHPSIVIWDSINEPAPGHLKQMNEEVNPVIREWDPTRPIEPLDFKEHHTYQYSQAEVLNTGPLGLNLLGTLIEVAPPFEELVNSPEITMTNEYPWLWFNTRGEVSGFIEDSSLPRLMGPNWDQTDTETRFQFQAWLNGELTELYRRIEMDAIQPFVLLGDNEGLTFHYFREPLEDLDPKPVYGALKNALAPFGVSIELWDRHFLSGETRTVDVFVFNDDPLESKSGTLRLVKRRSGLEIDIAEQEVTVDPVSTLVVPFEVTMSGAEQGGMVEDLVALLTEDGQGPSDAAFSHKPLRVYPHVQPPAILDSKNIGVLSTRGEVAEYLETAGLSVVPIEVNNAPAASEVDIVVLEEGAPGAPSCACIDTLLANHLAAGGSIVLIEPAFGLPEGSYPLAADVSLEVGEPIPSFQGGYDSIIWLDPDAPARPHLWEGIGDADLWFFNGAYGNEMVSEVQIETVTGDEDAGRLANLTLTGSGLSRSGLWEMSAGGGRIVVNRMQLRGRLLGAEDGGGLYDRRVDPVAQRLLFNLLAEYVK